MIPTRAVRFPSSHVVNNFCAAVALTLFYEAARGVGVPTGGAGGVFAALRRRALAERHTVLGAPRGGPRAAGDGRRTAGRAALGTNDPRAARVTILPPRIVLPFLPAGGILHRLSCPRPCPPPAPSSCSCWS